jgi:solute:Na+ symporter, SSS family
MTTAILILVGLYLLKSFLIAYKAHKHETKQNSEDYFLADRSLKWIALGFTVFASWVSTFAYIGVPGFYYTKGINWMIGFCLMGAGTPLLMWFVGRKMWVMGRKNGYITPGDLLDDAYKSKAVRVLSGLIGIVALIPYSLIQLIGIAKVLAVATNGVVSFEMGIVCVAITIALYTYFGGVRAIAWTDIFQGLIFATVVLIAAGLMLYHSGGLIDGIIATTSLHPERFILDTSNIGKPITFMMMLGLGFIVLPHMWQRTYMSKSAGDFTKGILLSSILGTGLITILLLVIGVYSISLFPQLGDIDNLMPTLFSRYFNYGLPLLVLGAFAAGMSTVDSQLLSSSSLLVKDIVEPLTNSSFTGKYEKTLGRLFVLALIVLMVVLSLLPMAKASIVLIASKGFGIGLLLFCPLIYVLYSKRHTRNGALYGLIVGAGILIAFDLPFLELSLPFGFGAPALATLVQVIIMESAWALGASYRLFFIKKFHG